MDFSDSSKIQQSERDYIDRTDLSGLQHPVKSTVPGMLSGKNGEIHSQNLAEYRSISDDQRTEPLYYRRNYLCRCIYGSGADAGCESHKGDQSLFIINIRCIYAGITFSGI